MYLYIVVMCVLYLCIYLLLKWSGWACLSLYSSVRLSVSLSVFHSDFYCSLRFVLLTLHSLIRLCQHFGWPASMSVFAFLVARHCALSSRFYCFIVFHFISHRLLINCLWAWLVVISRPSDVQFYHLTKQTVRNEWAEHVSGAEPAKKPLHAPAYFCNPRCPLRSRSATSRSALRSAPSFFYNARSTLRFAPPDFRPAPLSFPLRSLSAHMLW